MNYKKILKQLQADADELKRKQIDLQERHKIARYDGDKWKCAAMETEWLGLCKDLKGLNKRIVLLRDQLKTCATCLYADFSAITSPCWDCIINDSRPGWRQA